MGYSQSFFAISKCSQLASVVDRAFDWSSSVVSIHTPVNMGITFVPKTSHAGRLSIAVPNSPNSPMQRDVSRLGLCFRKQGAVQERKYYNSPSVDPLKWSVRLLRRSFGSIDPLNHRSASTGRLASWRRLDFEKASHVVGHNKHTCKATHRGFININTSCAVFLVNTACAEFLGRFATCSESRYLIESRGCSGGIIFWPSYLRYAGK